MTKILLNELKNEVATQKLEKFMKENNYSNDCVAFVKDYWPHIATTVVAGATLSYLGREAIYLKTDAMGLGQVKKIRNIYNTLQKLGGKAKSTTDEMPALFSRKRLLKLGVKHRKLIAAAAVVAAISGFGVKKVYDDFIGKDTKAGLMRAIRDALTTPLAALTGGFGRLYTSTKESEVGRGSGMQGNECAQIAIPLIFAAAAAITLTKTGPVRPINSLLDSTLNLFMKFLKKTKVDIQEAVIVRVTKNMEDKIKEGVDLPVKAREEIFDIVRTTTTYNAATRRQANQRISALGLDPKYQSECEDMIELIYKDGVYISKEVFGELEDQTYRAVRRADDLLGASAREVREQMGFVFDDIIPPPTRLDGPPISQAPAIVKNIDQSLDNKNIKDAIRQLEDLADSYRAAKLLDDGAAKAKVVRMAREIRDELRKRFGFQPSDYDVIIELVKRSGEIFTEIKVADAKGLATKFGADELQLSDEAVERILREDIDEVLFYQTSNLPLPAPTRKIPSPRDEFPEMREAAVRSTMGFFQTLKGKVSPGTAVKLSLGAFTALFAGGGIYSVKKNRPTGAPYYFEDKSIYDKLGLNYVTGQDEYKKIRDNLLTDQKLIKDINSWMFDHDKFKLLNNVLEKKAKSEKEVLDIDTTVDSILKEYAKAAQTVYTLDRGRADTLGLARSGEEGSIKDRNRNLKDNQLIFEIFLFNDTIIRKLNNFYKNEKKDRTETPRRLQKLKQIFKPSRSHRASVERKIQKLDSYFNNDNRMKRNKKTNEVKFMSKKDIRQLVAEVLNENSGQGYGKYPYHSNEHSESEPDQDYQTEWKMFVDECCGRKVKNVDGDPNTIEDMAVEVAKLFVKDSDLFRDVLETAGNNKSIGVEIMQQLKAAKEKKKLDKEMNV